jgi:hypothetical protein
METVPVLGSQQSATAHGSAERFAFSPAGARRREFDSTHSDSTQLHGFRFDDLWSDWKGNPRLAQHPLMHTIVMYRSVSPGRR